MIMMIILEQLLSSILVVILPPSQNSLAVEGRCLSRSSSFCHSQEFCGSCFLAEDASIFFGENQYEDGKFARSRLHILGLGIGLSYAQICGAYFKRHN